MRLGPKFFNRNTATVARDLLGKFLVRRIGRREIAGMIMETEAYHGPHDRASHASRGMTKRTEIMFGPPGRAYVYLIYGMYHCLNFVTMPKGFPAAVLIRGVKSEKLTRLPDGQEVKSDGPGKLCRALNVTRKLNGAGPDSKELWIEDRGMHISRSRIVSCPRVGVEYAGLWKHKQWRFALKK